MHSKIVKRKKFTVWQRIRYHFVSCANICSIHGFAHIVRKNINPLERLLWILLVTFATGWCVDLALQAWNRYQTRPTVISLERDHWKWNTTFPAVTLCLKAIDNDRAEALISNLNFTNQTDVDDFRNFLAALATVNFAMMEFDKYINDSIYQNVDQYMDWVLQASSTLDSPVTIEQSFGELHEFETILTEFGLCFAYNSRIAIYSTPEYLSNGGNKLVDLNNSIIMINPSISTPTLSISMLSSEYQIFFHDSNEIAEMSTKGMLIPAGTFGNFELSIESVQTTPEVRDLKISQRNCRLSEESNLEHSPVYSYNLCRSECRRHLSLRLCNCIPYYYYRHYSRHGDERICDPAGMQCLHENHISLKHLIDEGHEMKCPCIQNCDTDSIIISKYEVKSWFMGTNLKCVVTRYPTVRYKRTLIFSNIDMLVQIGGVAGLFLGCSVLSLIELAYYFTLRFYWGVIRGRTI